MSIVFENDIGKELRTAFNDMQKPMAKAAAAAMLDVAQIAVKEGRAQIAAAGFSDRKFKWQSGFGYRVFPGEGRPSLSPAARVEHKVGIASVFEHGSEIFPKTGLMWLPLERNLPPGFRGGPRQFRGKLRSVNRPGRRPLLVGPARGNKDKSVPLFVGIDRAKMPQRFHLYDTIKRAADRLSEFYHKHLQP